MVETDKIELPDVASNGDTVTNIKKDLNENHLASNGKEVAKVENVKQADSDKNEKKKKKEKVDQVSMFQLFRFANKLDVLLMIVGSICGCAQGSALPVMIIVFGTMTTSFANSSYVAVTNLTDDQKEFAMEMFEDKIRQAAIYYAIIGAVVLVVGYVQVTCWLTVSYRQTFRLRRRLFSSVLHQEIGWFDTSDAGEMSTRLSDDVNKIQEGVGDKISNTIQYLATFITGLIIALCFGWKLALVVLAVSPLMAAAAALMTYMITTASNKESTAYAKAGAIAEEVLTAIRTVVAFGGQEKECKRYESNLEEAKKFGIKKGMSSGSGIGMVFFIMFGSYALAFWFGGKLVRENEMQIGDMLTVFFCVIIGSMSLGNAGPNFQSIGTAKGAAYKLWSLVDRKSKINSSDPKGKTLPSLAGNIEFKDVHFHFPSREDVKILRGLNMNITQGQTVAVVGASGCGKSTVVQLLQRFYDPIQGSVTIDGVDVKDFNIKWLRQQIGIVSQEPVLFATTIAENISYGSEGVTQEQIKQAAIEANAHGFISKLPKQYDTLVGERGAQLSGGQKQRIAIARALVRNPRIILLDEATSALDTESEATVQAALDKVQNGRTTIVVAHRLSTIKNADVIYGIKEGVVHESGSHDELMEKQGIYYQLVMNQKMREKKIVEGEEEEEEEDEEEDKGIEILERGSLGRRSVTSLKNLGRKSSTKESAEETEVDEKKSKRKEVSIWRVFKHNSPEWWIILIGCVMAAIHGGVQPSFAIIFARFLGIFGANVLPDERERYVILYACLFLLIGIVAGVTMFVQATMFAISGERLTKRMRSLVFKYLLKQNIAYFDDSNNSVGAMTTRLATDAAAIQGATGARIGMAFQSIASLGVGIIIGFVYSWQLTLLIIAVCPFSLAAAVFQMRLAKGFSGKNNSALEASGKIATEALSNIRTVAALTLEEKFIKDYCEQLSGPQKDNLRKAHVYGIAYSFAQSVSFFANAAIFMLGAYLIRHNYLDFQGMFTVFGAIIFGAMSLGRASEFAPDYAKAKESINSIFELIDSCPVIDVYSTDGAKPSSCDGLINFTGVTFAYPARQSVKVLRKLDMTVEPGTMVALVGSSGCGKSTTVQLLERFYDVLEGSITLDDKDLRSLNAAWLRAQLGIVSQEPILFDCSIKENIAYGDNSREIPMDEIIQAARMANIHSFIESLPQGYETGVGDKGAQLSGGQKQRIAIARALVRNPKVLLLDEATSALDTESEKVVQEALDRAQEGRTSLVIAHRLSTIQNAHRIFVFQHGVIAESGRHHELMAQKGIYYRLNQAQGQKS